jgi:hypothetical protein
MMTQLAVIGLGYWGPSYMRNFSDGPDFKLVEHLKALDLS